MVAEHPSVTPQDVIDANREFYSSRAGIYDVEEHCASDSAPRELLAGVLSRALLLCPDRSAPAILDACGGSGNASEILAGLGYRTTVADVSPEMLGIWRAKAAALGFNDAETIETDIDSFLENDGRTWDMIVFSSAMHHLENYPEVAFRATQRLAPGGTLVTIFDPTLAEGALSRQLRRFDWLAFEALSHPKVFLGLLTGKLRELARRPAAGSGEAAEAPAARLAERYAQTGVDESRLIAAIESAGGEIVVHERYSHQRLAVFDFIFSLLKKPASFHLVARKRHEKTGS